MFKKTYWKLTYEPNPKAPNKMMNFGLSHHAKKNVRRKKFAIMAKPTKFELFCPVPKSPHQQYSDRGFIGIKHVRSKFSCLGIFSGRHANVRINK